MVCPGDHLCDDTLPEPPGTSSCWRQNARIRAGCIVEARVPGLWLWEHNQATVFGTNVEFAPLYNCIRACSVAAKVHIQATISFVSMQTVKPWGSLNVGWECSACNRFPAPVHCRTYQCRVTSHCGSCIPTSEISVMELGVSLDLRRNHFSSSCNIL